MGIVDILFIGILVLGFISGLQKGLITSFLACIAMAVASILASDARTGLVQALMKSDFRVWLQNNLEDPAINVEHLFNIGSYVLMFIVIYFAIMLVVNLINNVFRMPKLRVFDCFLGGLLGVVRSYAIICLIIAVVPAIVEPIDTKIVGTLLEESVLGRFFTDQSSSLSDMFGIGAKVMGL